MLLLKDFKIKKISNTIQQGIVGLLTETWLSISMITNGQYHLEQNCIFMHFLPVLLHFCPSSFHQPSVVAALPSSVLESWHALLAASFPVHFQEASHKVQVGDQQKGAHCQERSLIFGPCPISINNNASKSNLQYQLFDIIRNKKKSEKALIK